MKEDERLFLELMNRFQDYPHRSSQVRDLIRDMDAAGTLNYKRAWKILEKWTTKGWYDYGVSLDLGWLTEAGRKAAGIGAINEG